MAKQIVLNTAHYYNWVNIGGAVKHPDSGKGFNISPEVNQMANISDSDVKVLASDGYGDAALLRSVIAQ